MLEKQSHLVVEREQYLRKQQESLARDQERTKQKSNKIAEAITAGVADRTKHLTMEVECNRAMLMKSIRDDNEQEDRITELEGIVRRSKNRIQTLESTVRENKSFKSAIEVIRTGSESDENREDLFKIVHQVLAKQSDKETGIATLSWHKLHKSDSMHVERYVST